MCDLLLDLTWFSVLFGLRLSWCRHGTRCLIFPVGGLQFPNFEIFYFIWFFDNLVTIRFGNSRDVNHGFQMEALLITVAQKILLSPILRRETSLKLIWDLTLVFYWIGIFFELHARHTLVRKHVSGIILIRIHLQHRRPWNIPNWTIQILFVLVINAYLTGWLIYGTKSSELNFVDLICY